MAKRGKLRKRRRCFPFQEACALIQKEQISSKSAYYKWWDENRPAKMPRRPDSKYRLFGWNGWNHFLGNNNPRPYMTKTCRPYDEAKAFAHTLGFKRKNDWLDWVAHNPDKPIDIPSRPDIYYRSSGDWFTWKEFLGYDTYEKVVMSNTITPILYILKLSDRPENVYKINVTHGGMSSIRDACARSQAVLFKAYKYDPPIKYEGFIAKHGNNYWEGLEDEYAMNNIFEFMFELEAHLLPIVT